MFDDGFGGNDFDFDEFNDWDATDCANGDYNTWEEREVFNDREGDEEVEDISGCANGDHEYELDGYCGAHVCMGCGDHKGLARCYCGWSLSGDDGYAELLDMGETIEEDW